MTDPESNHEFHEKIQPIHRKITSLLIGWAPPAWKAPHFEIEVNYLPVGERRAVTGRFYDRESESHIEGLPEDLFALVTELHGVFTEYGQAWERSDISLVRDDQGRIVQIETDYEY